MRLPSIALSLALVAAGTACSDPTTGPSGAEEHDLRPGYTLLGAGYDITLTAEAESFEPGAPVTLVLRNGSAEPVGHNLCFHALERSSIGDWAPAGEQEDQICIAILHILDPGAEAAYATELPSGLPEGEYRFRVALSLMESEEFRDQVSQPFHVQP